MYSHDRKVHTERQWSLLTLLAVAVAITATWLAWRCSKPLECFQKEAIDNVIYCKMPVQR